MKIASSLRQLWHQLWEYPGGKKLNPDAIPTIFEGPEPTGTSSIASDSGDAATFSRKRTTVTASNNTLSLIANRNDQERRMKKESELG